MNKITKLILALSFFVLVIVASYYVAFYLPRINREKFLLTMQEKCRAVGQDAFTEDGKLYGGVENLFEPQYAYNERLNTCIYASGYNFTGSPSAGTGGDFITHNCDAYWERWVKNSYTNEKILYVFNSLDKKCQWTTSTDRIDKFNTDMEVLFGS